MKTPILITGGTGFVGRHLRRALKNLEYANIHFLSRGSIDLTDGAATSSWFDKVQPQTVFHLAAACGGIGANSARPADFIRDNLLMGMNVLQACREHQAKLVLVGSVCSYPKFCQIPFREEDLWEGYPEETNAPYGIAKKTIMVMAQAYRDQYQSNIVTLIPTNMYGPGDDFDLETSHVIPAMIRKMVEARRKGLSSVTLWGSGSCSRDFLFVTDTVRALIQAAESYDGKDPINLGSGFETDIYALADTVKRLTRFDGFILWDQTRPNGQPRRLLDTSRALTHLDGWKPQVSLDDGLRETIAWYEEQNP